VPEAAAVAVEAAPLAARARAAARPALLPVPEERAEAQQAVPQPPDAAVREVVPAALKVSAEAAPAV
jgi:hypothetical protein